MRKLSIGLIAGTPVDTKMGLDFIKKKGLDAVGVPTASNPEEQNFLQYMDPNALTQKILEAIKVFENQGIFRTMIYCNSLSSAVEINLLRDQNPDSIIISPLDIYADLALQQSKLHLWAANAQCLSTIEKIFYSRNPAIKIIGFSLLPLVQAIEAQMPPDEIISKFDLARLCRSIGEDGVLVLGCTHFPYLLTELRKLVPIDIIDPGEEMLSRLLI